MPTPPPPSPKSLVRESYNAIAPSYLSFISTLPTPTIPWTDKLLSHLPSPPVHSKVLELGCGNGVPCTLHLAPRVGRVVANDISAAQVEIAREKVQDGNVEFVVGDMTELEFDEGAFEAVVALYSLVHLPLEEQPNMLRKVRGWMGDGRVLLCNFDVEEDAGSVMDDWLGAKMFKAGFGVEGSKKMLEDTGFKVLEAEVVETVDDKKTVPFLWVLAKKVAR